MSTTFNSSPMMRNPDEVQILSTPQHVGQGGARIFDERSGVFPPAAPGADVTFAPGGVPMTVRLDAGVQIFQTAQDAARSAEAGAALPPAAPPVEHRQVRPVSAVPQTVSLDPQRLAWIVSRLAYIKSECHQAVHPPTLRDRLRDVIEVLEVLVGGAVSDAQPNVVPGVPLESLDDPSKTRVVFFGGPGQGRAV